MRLLESVKCGCAEVAAQAEHVRLDREALAPYAERLKGQAAAPLVYDTVHHFFGAPGDTLAYLFTLDTINFGSGYFPYLQKRPGMSGYFTVASSLKDYFEVHGALSAEALRDLRTRDCAALFGQPLEQPEQAELMQLFSKALNDLGVWLLATYGSDFRHVIEATGGSAERLAECLAEMPYFQDVATYRGKQVPLYKRAQITPSDIALAFDGEGFGRFSDLDELTIFADNLVPHVLRVDGLLSYSPTLVAKLESGEVLEAGSAEEVEIRAVTVHAVEELAKMAAIPARQLDIALWNRGQALPYRKTKRHRTRSVFY